MKRFFLVVFSLLLFCTLGSGCAGQDPGSLKICVDFGIGPVQFGNTPSGAMTLFLNRTKELGGPEQIEVEYLPKEGEQRKAALSRIRTEIMSGEGPDVFLVMCGRTNPNGEDALFPFPEKVMKENLFLPLDKYLENAQFLEWDKLAPAVMAAGQTEEGQMVLPLAYSFSTTIFQRQDIPVPDQKMTWADCIGSQNPVLQYSATKGDSLFYPNYLGDVLGQLADYGQEQLSFSQEELLALTKDALSLENQRDSGAFSTLPVHCQTAFCVGYDLFLSDSAFSGRETALTYLPLCNRQGGVTASVTAFAAISAGTKHPEEAFFLLDVLLRPETVAETAVDYTLWDWLISGTALPVYEEAGQETSPVTNSKWSLSDENFQELCRLRKQISAVKFNTVLDRKLNDLYQRSLQTGSSSESYDEEIASLTAETYADMERTLAES